MYTQEQKLKSQFIAKPPVCVSYRTGIINNPTLKCRCEFSRVCVHMSPADSMEKAVFKQCSRKALQA